MFYKEYGRLEIAGDVVGSTKRGQNSRTSSVVMSYWPGTGDKINDDVINYERMRVGVIQYFLKHTVTLTNSQGNTVILPHIFCHIYWKKVHPQSSWYGTSATVCTDLYEDPDACCFMPVQRIASRCAYSKLLVDFTTHKETVFVVAPIPIHYNL